MELLLHCAQCSLFYTPIKYKVSIDYLTQSLELSASRDQTQPDTSGKVLEKWVSVLVLTRGPVILTMWYTSSWCARGTLRLTQWQQNSLALGLASSSMACGLGEGRCPDDISVDPESSIPYYVSFSVTVDSSTVSGSLLFCCVSNGHLQVTYYTMSHHYQKAYSLH